MKQACDCPCGAARIEVSGDPIVRFLCHCRICQEVFKGPCSDVTVFRAAAVTVPERKALRFRRYRPPPALNRGICAECGAPVVGFMGSGALALFGFVPSRNFSRPEELPRPARRLFYDRRVADVADSIPRLEGYWRSDAFVMRTLLASLVGRQSSA
jgi:hypothetical protein